MCKIWSGSDRQTDRPVDKVTLQLYINYILNVLAMAKTSVLYEYDARFRTIKRECRGHGSQNVCKLGRNRYVNVKCVRLYGLPGPASCFNLIHLLPV